jgi:DNA-binding phage protein
MNAPSDKCYEESLIQALADPLEAAAYLDAAMELEDMAAYLVAMRQVAQAHDTAEAARRSGSK